MAYEHRLLVAPASLRLEESCKQISALFSAGSFFFAVAYANSSETILDILLSKLVCDRMVLRILTVDMWIEEGEKELSKND